MDERRRLDIIIIIFTSRRSTVETESSDGNVLQDMSDYVLLLSQSTISLGMHCKNIHQNIVSSTPILQSCCLTCNEACCDNGHELSGIFPKIRATIIP